MAYPGVEPDGSRTIRSSMSRDVVATTQRRMIICQSAMVEDTEDATHGCRLSQLSWPGARNYPLLENVTLVRSQSCAGRPRLSDNSLTRQTLSCPEYSLHETARTLFLLSVFEFRRYLDDIAPFIRDTLCPQGMRRSKAPIGVSCRNFPRLQHGFDIDQDTPRPEASEEVGG